VLQKGDVMTAQWIKLKIDIFDNRKIKMLESMPEGDTLLIIWFKLLSLAGQTNDRGYVYFAEDVPYTANMLSIVLGKSEDAIQNALDAFSKYKMIELDEDGFIFIPGWAEHQNVDGMEKIKEQNRVRKQNQRLREKADKAEETDDSEENDTFCDMSRDKSRNGHVTSRDSHAIDKEEDIDKEKDIKKESEKKETRKRFIPPTLEELEAYKLKAQLNVDCKSFRDYYESNGWMVGKNHMKDWQATMRRWSNTQETARSGTPNQSAAPNRFQNFEQRTDDLDALLKNGRVFRGANV